MPPAKGPFHLPCVVASCPPQSDDDDDDDSLVPGMDVSEVRHTAKRSQKEELRCVLAVIRHGGGAGGKGGSNSYWRARPD